MSEANSEDRVKWSQIQQSIDSFSSIAVRGNNFWHYTSFDKAISILTKKEFHISSFSNMNDLDEANRHKSDAGRIFALCFNNSRPDSIPLSYLYAGILGNGVAIGLTPAGMRSLYNTAFNELYPKEMTKEGEIKSIEELPLKKGVDYNVRIGWVVYRTISGKRVDTQNNFVIVKGNKLKLDATDLREYGTKSFFVKAKPWNYESEFRIVVELHEDTFCKLKNSMNDGSILKLSLSFANVKEEYLRIAQGPESNQNIQDQINTIQLVNSFGDNGIRMNIIERNRKEIEEYCRNELKLDKTNNFI